MATKTKPVKSEAATNNKPKKGLRPLQVKVLELLDKHPNGMDRAGLYDALKFKAHSGLNRVLGYNDPERRAKSDAEDYPSLLSLSCIKMQTRQLENSKVNVYVITAKGKQMLAKAST